MCYLKVKSYVSLLSKQNKGILFSLDGEGR